VETHSAEPLAQHNVGYLLARALQRWNTLLGEAFARAGFPEVRPASGAILVPLTDEDGLQIVDLARRAGLSKQTMTTQLKALEALGLVERVADPADRRAYRIYLTERGRAFKQAAGEILRELDTLLAARLTPAGVAQLSEMLRTMSRLQRPDGAAMEGTEQTSQ
jgi:DNA-binding MarR family transcriptional regulator